MKEEIKANLELLNSGGAVKDGWRVWDDYCIERAYLRQWNEYPSVVG